MDGQVMAICLCNGDEKDFSSHLEVLLARVTSLEELKSYMIFTTTLWRVM